MPSDRLGGQIPHYVLIEATQGEPIQCTAQEGSQLSPAALLTDPSNRTATIARAVAHGWRTVMLHAALLVPLTETRREVLGDALETYAWGDILELDVALRETPSAPGGDCEAIEAIAPFLCEAEKAAIAKALFDLLQDGGVLTGRPLAYVEKILQRIKPLSAETLKSLPRGAPRPG